MFCLDVYGSQVCLFYHIMQLKTCYSWQLETNDHYKMLLFAIYSTTNLILERPCLMCMLSLFLCLQLHQAAKIKDIYLKSIVWQDYWMDSFYHALNEFYILHEFLDSTNETIMIKH